MADSPDGLACLGWSPVVADRYRMVARTGCVPGRVVRVDRGGGLVATATAVTRARAGVVLAVGDWVAALPAGDDLLVVGVAERSSQLTRRDPCGLTQVLAANVDVVFVTAPSDRLSLSRVEREVAMSWDSGALPVVLVTKADLAQPDLLADVRRRVIGVEVITTSVVMGDGLPRVAELVQPALTAVLLGPSGAGKSSIVNWLLGGEPMATSAVRAGDHRGRHTTHVRQLVVVPSGGCLIDTPGLRSLSLAEDHGGVAAAFPDVEALAAACRFHDCRHSGEPGCAVLAKVEAGLLDARRLANYTKLQSELSFETRRDDPLARAAAERVWKIRAKAARRLRSGQA